MTFTHALPTNNYGPAKFIVDASAANGTHTTLTAAMASAVAGDTIFVRPGTYTENFTWKANVDIVSYTGDAYTSNTKIVGKITCTDSGFRSMSGISLQTNSDFIMVISGVTSTSVYLINCYIRATNHSAFSLTSSSTSLYLYQCNGDLSTTGINYFTQTGAGGINVFGCILGNSGGSSTASTINVSAGGWDMRYSTMLNDITSTQGTLGIYWCNTGIIICNDSGSNSVSHSFVDGGTSSAISIGGVLEVLDCTVKSSNTNAITGAGTLKFAFISFRGTSSGHNVTTETPLATLI